MPRNLAKLEQACAPSWGIWCVERKLVEVGRVAGPMTEATARQVARSCNVSMLDNGVNVHFEARPMVAGLTEGGQ
jgi:hypothetical protein